MLFKDKQIFEGLNILGGQIKELYDIEKEDVSKLTAQISAVTNDLNQKFIFEKTDMEVAKNQIKELKESLISLTAAVQELAKIKPIAPKAEPSGIVGWCINCKEEVPMVSISPEPVVSPLGTYKMGKCSKCGSKLFKQVTI